MATKQLNLTKRQRKALRKAWVKALRSGKYRQTTGALETSQGNCCLGVACRVFDKKFPGRLKIRTCCDVTSFDGRGYALPMRVQDAFGLASTCGNYDDNALDALNDDGKSFKYIARVIEREPKGLFID